MPNLTLQRIPFSKDADNRLRMLKSRSGITPNLLARIGFCLSLEEQGVPSPFEKDAEVGREINRFTLLGEYDQAFVALLWAKLSKDGLEREDIDQHFVAHMNRGVELLTARMKTISDLGTIS